MYSAVPGTCSASFSTRRKDRSSDRVLCTSAMFSKPARPSRNSLAYMCMTMSLSSAWMTPRPPFFDSTWNTSQMSPKSTMRPLRLGVMSVVKIFTEAWPASIASPSWPGMSGPRSPSTMVCSAQSQGQPSPVQAAMRSSIAACTVWPCMTRVKSMMVVVPPNSAARPTTEGPWVSVGSPLGTTTGQRQWVCGSMPPGMTILPVASTSRAPAESGKPPRSATATTLPPAIATSAGPMACGVTTQSPVMTRSTIARPHPSRAVMLRRSRCRRKACRVAGGWGRCAMARTLFDKIWDAHVVADLGEGWALLHIDRVLLHDLSGARALSEVAERGHALARPDLVFATPDHAVSTAPGRTGETFAGGARTLAGPAHAGAPRPASGCTTSASPATASSMSWRRNSPSCCRA